jgi:hypothetical protein
MRGQHDQAKESVMIRWTKRLVLMMHATALTLAVGGSPAHAVLQGDCGDDGTVFIGDVQRCVNIFLMPSLLATCPACDQGNDGNVDIGDVQGAANCFLNPAGPGCLMVVTPNTPTPTNTTVNTAANTPTPTNTPVNTAENTATPTNTTVNTAANTSTPTNTAVNTAANTSTPTNTAVNTAANTPTPTDTVAVATATATPSNTPMSGGTPMLVFSVEAEVLGGGGLATQCQGTCAAGPRVGQACTNAAACRVCVGGNNNGNPCVANAQCTAGGGTCSAPTTCANATCRGGAYNGVSCNSGADCPGCNPNLICTGAGTPLACCSGPDAGTCPVVGSCAIVQNPLFAVRLGLNGVCVPRTAPDVSCLLDADCPAGKTCRNSGFTLEGYTNNDGDGTLDLRIPEESLFLPPAVVSGIGTACVVAVGDGVGVVDCDGGRPNSDFTLSIDHNTTPAFTCLGGTRKLMACTTSLDCPGLQAVCVQGTNVCASGSNQGMPCEQGGDDCPAFAACNNEPGSPTNGNGGPENGLPDDPECENSFVAPTGDIDYACLEGTRQCVDGPNDGGVCDGDEDCPESTCGGPCSGTSPHPGTCNSPTVATIGGTFVAGDMVVTLPLAISILPSAAEFGPDQLACTADDMPPTAPAGVPVALSTGVNTIQVFDAANSPGVGITPGAACGAAPCVSRIDGTGTSCTNLMAGNLSGVVFGGGFPALDSAAGDIATTFQFVVP